MSAGDREVDVVVVGGGVAGLSVATRLRATHRVLLVSDGPGSTRWAQGGVAAAVGPGDTPAQHAEDTLAAGAGACDGEAVAILTGEGPARVAELVGIGARFDRDGEDLLLGREGGHRRRRVLHARGDATGVEVDRVLELEAHRLAVPRLQGRVDGLLLSRGRVVGVEVGGAQVRARAVVLATGGLGHAYPTTTNPVGVTGDGLALALLAGATLTDLEFVQFHPTALWTGAAYGQVPLVTEALRGEGAVLRDHDGRPLMQGRHPMADLAPRDVVARAVHEAVRRRDGAPGWRATRAGGARAVHAAVRRRDGAHVWLDTGAVDALERRFPTVAASCRAHGVDPAMIPVAPAEHYLCGGVATDAGGRSDVAGLYAVGEVAATGVHGANRLASNSLLEGLVFGRRTAEAVATDLAAPAARGVGAVESRRLHAPGPVSGRARELLGAAAGLVREGVALSDARRALLERPTAEVTWLVATAVLGAAEVRRESRGAHLRSDHPGTHSGWRRRVLVRIDDDGVPRAAGDRQERAA